MLRIYGHSDDCIEIDWNRGVAEEEFYVREGRSFLRFDGGLVVAATFCADKDEAWRFRVVFNPEGLKVEELGPNEDGDYELNIRNGDGPAYSPAWVRHDATPNGPDDEQIEDELDSMDWRDMSKEQRRKVYEVINPPSKLVTPTPGATA